MKDEILIKKFISGNVSAFNTLVWRWQKPIYNFIYRYIGDEDIAKDILQQTFIRAYKSLSKLKDHSKFSTWLFQIALNQSKTELMKKKRTMVSIDEFHDDDGSASKRPKQVLIDPDLRPEHTSYNENLSNLLKDALQHIPSDQRVVIVMKEYHGLKFTEISEILREPINTVKSRMYYGLNSLRKILQKWDLDKEDLVYEM